MTGAVRQEYAGVVSRVVAFLMDALIVTVVATGAVIVVELIGLVAGAQARELIRALAPVFLIVAPTLLAMYGTAFWALAGRTPGMALLGVRVARASGRRVSWLSSLVRAVVLACFPIGALWCLVDRRHQAIHDKFAGTIVVRVPPGHL